MAQQMAGLDRHKIVDIFNIAGDFTMMSVMTVGYEKVGLTIKEKNKTNGVATAPKN